MIYRILRDINGNDIFEGDLVELTYYIKNFENKRRGIIRYHRARCFLDDQEVYLTDYLKIIKPKMNRRIYEFGK